MFHSGTDELLELYKAVYELYKELKMEAPGQPVRVGGWMAWHRGWRGLVLQMIVLLDVASE